MAIKLGATKGAELSSMRFMAGGLWLESRPVATVGRIGYRAAARHLGVPVSTLYVLVHRRQVPHLRLSKRLVVFDTADLDRWLDERRQE